MTHVSPPQHKGNQARDQASVVRNNAWSTGISALIMCLYGFIRLQKPTPTDLFSWSGLVFYHTLRFGGIIMAMVTLWSLLGHRAVLVVDSISSTAIGALFLLTAVGMVVNRGNMLNGALLVLFGWLFIRAGIQNWRLFQHLTLEQKHNSLMESTVDPEETLKVGTTAPHRSTPSVGTLVSTEILVEPEAPVAPVEPDRNAEGGFLASFGQDPPPPRP